MVRIVLRQDSSPAVRDPNFPGRSEYHVDRSVMSVENDEQCSHVWKDDGERFCQSYVFIKPQLLVEHTHCNPIPLRTN